MSSNNFTRAIKTLWEKKDTQSQGQVLPSYNIQAQVDDVFLVLALMGEALLPLAIFDDTQYDSTLRDVQFAISNCGNAVVENIFDSISADLKYLSVAALTVCAAFAPMHIYRGFGASIHGDWDWACPDYEYLEGKAKKAAGMFSKTPDPQPNRPVLLAFDRAIQLLQMKGLTFLCHRPNSSWFSEHQPRYTPRSRTDVLGELHNCREWKRYVSKNGHPAPSGMTMSTWSMPWAGWTSPFSCEMTRDFEQVLANQMDPGRILHAFVCRDMLNLQDGHVLALPCGSSAEVLACWLADCPGMLHKIVTWDQMDVSKHGRLGLLDRKILKRMGRYPLPNRFAVRDAKAALLPRPPVRTIPAFVPKSETQTTQPSIAPPIYSPAPPTMVHELGIPDPVELDSSSIAKESPKDLLIASGAKASKPSAFVTQSDEMPLTMASLGKDLPSLPSSNDESKEETATMLNNDASNNETATEMHDTSAIPAPLRLRNPRSFAAELHAEPYQPTVSRSGTLASVVSSTDETVTSFSPISPMTPVVAENITHTLLPHHNPTFGSSSPHYNNDSQLVGGKTEEDDPNNRYLEYGQAASG